MPAVTMPPDIRIALDGQPLPPAQTADVISVTIREDLGALTMFTIELYNWNQHSLEFTWSDGPSFLPGAEIDLSLGFVDDLTSVLRRGEVTSLEPHFWPDEPARVVVRGYDRGHRLQRGRRTRSFVKRKDSDIATQLAQEAGLSARATATATAHDHIFQHNQTDWAFLTDRASRNGFVIHVRGDQLHFGPPKVSPQPVATLNLSRDVESFHPRLSSRAQVDQVVVRGWNMAQKTSVTARAKAGSELLTVGEGTSGLKQTSRAFGSTETVVTDLGPADSREADGLARAELTRGALLYITGELTCQGRPEVHAGDTVQVEEAGKRFSGTYLVTGVTHSVEMASGFRSRFQMQRSAAR